MCELEGVVPIVLIPFDAQGAIDEASLRRVVRYELEQPINGLGVCGFASEAYKLTDQERMRCAQIVADEVAGCVPLVIGMAPGSTEAGIEQARFYETLKPSALMVLPPCTMALEQAVLVEHYVTLADTVGVPVMVQHSPHIAAYGHSALSIESLRDIAERSENAHYFKIEGAGAVARMAALRKIVPDRIRLFGGGGGITWPDELRAGAAGVIPGCGFNEYFVRVWRAWQEGRQDEAISLLQRVQPLVDAVSNRGHEFSLHARKHLLKRAGIIEHATVRLPTIQVDSDELDVVGKIADALELRIACTS